MVIYLESLAADKLGMLLKHFLFLLQNTFFFFFFFFFFLVMISVESHKNLGYVDLCYLSRRSLCTMIQTLVPTSIMTMRQMSTSFILRWMSHVTNGNTNQEPLMFNLVQQGPQHRLCRYVETIFDTAMFRCIMFTVYNLIG